MMWTEDKIEMLKNLWTAGKSAGQIAVQVGFSRGAICAKLMRLGLKRGRPQPTAKPRIVSRPRRSLRKAGYPNVQPERQVPQNAEPAVDHLSSLPLRPLQKVVFPRHVKGSPVEY